MNDNSEDELDRKASKTKTIAFLAIIGALLLIGLVVLQAISSSGNDNMMDNGVVVPVYDDVRSPDPVKESAGPNGGTTPSPTGTGPGSNNSLLGPSDAQQ